MEVTSVRFEAFKSLYEVDCDFDHFTVITGPNGSGKSNLVDALSFLGVVYDDGLEFAVGRAGGFDSIAHRRTRRATRPVGIQVEVVITSRDIRDDSNFMFYGMEREEIPDDFRAYYRHSFAFRTSEQTVISDFEVTADSIEVLDAKHQPVFVVEREGGDPSDISVWAARATPHNRTIRRLLTPFDDSRFAYRFLNDTRLLPTSLLSDRVHYANLLYFVKRALGRTSVFQLSPFQCRGPGVPTPNAVLERHGENLPGAANHLRRNDERAWHQVQDAMRAVIPDLVSIEVAYTEDRRLALQFREEGVGRPWTTGEVSDGTIQALAMFIALFDTRTPLLIVEEPENSVHPWILRQFLDICSTIESKQVVLTTHSPVVLNYIDPVHMRLMSISSGRSAIKRFVDFAPELRDPLTSGEVSAFEAYDSGVVSEAVPRGFRIARDDEGTE